MRAAMLASALVLVACSSDQAVIVSDPNIMPQNYRSDILAFLRTYLNDPTRIRTASISDIALRDAGRGQRYAVCLRFNARKSNGEYDGLKERIVFFLSGRLDTMAEARREQCANADYQPFPELEALTR
jgi:hypothetical protein